ncbi:MAG: hypothetical protein HY819_13135 [Acidobacteria bacterium]|nr:hypothetical protein [Acidobacteriota bacterium]
MLNIKFEEKLELIKFYHCQEEEALKLKQEIDEEACENYDTDYLSSVFLEMRYFSYVEDYKEKLDNITLINLFLKSLGEPYTKYMVNEPYVEHWQKLDRLNVRLRLISLLTGGTSGLTLVFYPTSVAENFADRLLAYIGEPTIFLASMFQDLFPPQFPKTGSYTTLSGSGYDLFRFPCTSEGIIFISENKIGILWCFGCD